MDLIAKLPGINGHTWILVVVDYFTKAAKFVAYSSNMTSEVTASPLMDEIYCKRGLPKTL